jgi:hypothetical protein
MLLYCWLAGGDPCSLVDDPLLKKSNSKLFWFESIIHTYLSIQHGYWILVADRERLLLTLFTTQYSYYFDYVKVKIDEQMNSERSG